MITKIINPKWVAFNENDPGIRARRIRARAIPIIGPAVNTKVFLGKTRTTSFMNSLTASAIGCKTPIKLTLLGPFRSCEYLRIFRSNSVIKATLMRRGRMKETCVLNFHIALGDTSPLLLQNSAAT